LLKCGKSIRGTVILRANWTLDKPRRVQKQF
jgi:hypothetical protein